LDVSQKDKKSIGGGIHLYGWEMFLPRFIPDILIYSRSGTSRWTHHFSPFFDAISACSCGTEISNHNLAILYRISEPEYWRHIDV
jgi:hypothetical protein